MYYKKISSQVILFFFSLFILQSCSDDSLSPVTAGISGKVLGSGNNPLPNLKVKIGEQSTVTNSTGDFTLNNISLPYDILIIDEQSKSQALFKSVSISNIIIPEFYSFKNPDYTCYLKINIPTEFIQSGKKGKLIFTNGYDINSSIDITSEGTSLDIKMTEFKRVMGKLIILIYRTDNNGNILSYENYCEINDIEILPNRLLYYNINSTQLSLNPSERNITGKISIPSGYNTGLQYFYLNFASKNSSFNNPECKFSSINGNDFNFVVPVNLPTEFSILVNNYITDNDKYCLETFKIPENTNGINLQAKLPADIISPADNSTDINSNSVISHTAGSGSGVFITRFFKNDGYICSIVNTSESFLFSEVSKFEITNINNSYFFWSVEKHGEISNVNEYLNSFPRNSDRFVSKSQQRTFRTAH